MICYSKYVSPLGAITLAGDNDALTGLWFDGQKYFPSLLSCTEKDLPLFGQVRDWLERYFRGENPPIDFPIRTEGLPFRQQVWKLLRTIPYGKTVTYAHIAHVLGTATGKTCAAQAVGGAIGHNPISIVIPCHRVVGTNGALTGYAGGLDKKYFLLQLEGADLNQLHFPKSV